MKYFKTIALASLITLTFGCKAVKVENPTTDEQGNIEVAFSGSQELATQISKADPDQALPASSKALISVYAPAGAYNASTNKVLAKAYTAGDNGAMNADGGSAMLIPIGTYDFLSVGVIGAGTIPAMSATQVSGMISGVDYIAAKANKTIVAEVNGRIVALPYKHLTSLVKITVVPDLTALDEVTELTKLTITSSVGPWAIDVDKLANPNTAGQVNSVNPIGTQAPMTIETGTKTASYAMLPVSAGKTLHFTITAQIKTKGSATAIAATYTGEIALPTAGYVGGKRYSYTANVSSGTVTFSNATISDWGEGDTGVTDDLPTNEAVGV